jgi:hypothetical protein
MNETELYEELINKGKNTKTIVIKTLSIYYGDQAELFIKNDLSSRKTLAAKFDANVKLDLLSCSCGDKKSIFYNIEAISYSIKSCMDNIDKYKRNNTAHTASVRAQVIELIFLLKSCKEMSLDNLLALRIMLSSNPPAFMF